MKSPAINPRRTFIIADTHWGHSNIIGFCFRPEDHEAVMVREWQKYVGAEDTVLHLGDLSYTNNAYFRHVTSKKLPGRKLLIRGNHDKHRDSWYRQCGFRLVKPFSFTYTNRDTSEDWEISFGHYQLPIGALGDRQLHFHGHIHNNGYGEAPEWPPIPYRRNQINVSAEMMKYRPANLGLLLENLTT